MDIQFARKLFQKDTEEVFEILESLDENIEYQKVSIIAIDMIVRGTRLEKSIWEVHGSSINIDILDQGLSGGEKILAKVAFAIWTFGAAEFDLYTVFATLDSENVRRITKAVMLLTYFDSKRQIEDLSHSQMVKNIFKER